MKKYILFILVLCLGSLSGAETLAFITVMSGPVGSFSQVDSSSGVYANTVYLYNVGSILLEGNSTHRIAKLGNVDLQGGTAASDATLFRINANSITIKNSGNLIGGRLLAAKIYSTVEGTWAIQNTLYGNSATASDGEVQVNRMGINQRLTIKHSASEISQISVAADSGQPGNALGWCNNRVSDVTGHTGSSGEILLRSNCP